jgi:hypothetical protein
MLAFSHLRSKGTGNWISRQRLKLPHASACIIGSDWRYGFCGILPALYFAAVAHAVRCDPVESARVCDIQNHFVI